MTGNKGRDHRRDFRIELPQHFVNAVESFNDAVFDNDGQNEAYCSNIMDFRKTDFDLVYLDPPYWSPLSDNDYVRRYHFIEGYSKYWKGLKIDENTKTKKFRLELLSDSFLTARKCNNCSKRALPKIREFDRSYILFFKLFPGQERTESNVGKSQGRGAS